MVRFSDMLGGEGEPDDARAATAARDLPPLVDDESPDPDAPPVDEPAAEVETETERGAADPSPQDVLDRLTQYASAARSAAEPQPPPPPPPVEPATPEPATPEPATADPAPARSAADDDTGDDILPRGKRSLRSPRGKRDR